jgi:hypothetical protein
MSDGNINFTADLSPWLCPSPPSLLDLRRQATYFGGFYLKDAATIAGVSTQHPGDGAIAASTFAVLTTTQKALITSLVTAQDADWNLIVSVRAAICTQLRNLLVPGQSADYNAVMARSKQYGLLDGEISYFYATNFAQLRQSIPTTSTTQASLVAIRNTIYSIIPDGAFFYFTNIAMPVIPNTDYLFFPSATLTSRRQRELAAAKEAAAGRRLRH